MRICFLFLICISAIAVNSQPMIKLSTGNIVNDNPAYNPTNKPELFATDLFLDRYYLFLQFNSLPSEAAKKEIKKLGIRFYNYYNDRSYIASFPVGFDYNLLVAYNVYSVTKFNWYYKVHNDLYNGLSIPWALTKDGKFKVVISFTILEAKDLFIDDIAKDYTSLAFAKSNLFNAVEVIADIETIKKIAKHPLVQFIEPIGEPAYVEDIQGVSNHRNNTTLTTDNYINGKKYDASGITVVMGDDGFVGPHIDFAGRLENRATNTTASDTHGDHVLGIIGGASNFNPVVRGQAPSAKLITYDNYNDYNAFPDLYDIDSVRVTSHSLGQTCNSGYTSNARTTDQFLNNYPLSNHVHSSGNSGNSTCGGVTGGWATITGGFKAGKNSIAVGNVLKDDQLSSSSSKGPTKDGRIKPDVVAVGTSINSTQPNNTYVLNSGTSMACPAVAGSLAVMAGAYKKVFGNEAPGALLKAVMLNTADDLGNPGPDFSFGFGRVNMRRAINCIENNRFFTGSITTGVTNTHSILIPAGVSSIKVMTYWNDIEASAGAIIPLINNINTTITDPTSVIQQPWTLFAGSPVTAAQASAPATKGTDNINNVEQIQIDNPIAGNYSLNVEGTAIPVGPQQYYVVIQMIMNNEVVVTYPFGGESIEPGSSQRIRWDSDAGFFDNFSVDYSLDNGGSWINLATNVAGSQRFFDWTVPAGLANASARVRVTKNLDAFDISDTTFVILARPTTINFVEVCAGRSTLSWAPITGATGYDVFKLGEKFMEQVASTNTTSATLSNLGPSENWFSVRAKMAIRGAAGLRTNAISHTNFSFATCPPMPVKLTDFYGKINNGKPTLYWNVVLEENMLSYEVERSLSPSFENAIVVVTIKPKNQGSVSVNYETIDNEKLNEGTYYYRLRMIEADKATFSRVIPINLSIKIKTGFSVFPNPALNDVFITSSSDVLANISIYNMQGKLLQSATKAAIQKNVGFRVGVNSLSAGIYSVVITNEKTGEILGKQLFNKQ